MAALRQRRLWSVHNRPFMACRVDELRTVPVHVGGVRLAPVDEYGVFDRQPHPLLGRRSTARTRCLFGALERLTHARERRHWMFVAADGDTFVGTATVYVYRDLGGIYDVEVADAYQHRGIGTSLINAACARLRASGCRLAVLAASETGAGFYPRFGFTHVGRYPTFNYSIRKQRRDAAEPGW